MLKEREEKIAPWIKEILRWYLKLSSKVKIFFHQSRLKVV